MNDKRIVVTEIVNNENDNYINDPVLDGFHITKFREQLLDELETEETVSHILSNAYQSIFCFKNAFEDRQPYVSSKILCLGKVQSGKTSFFLAAITLAFDNGYKIAYVLGGTKLKLKKQNFGRVKKSFANNERIKVFDVDSSFNEDISLLIEKGYKIIFVILKNAAEKKNLGKLLAFSNSYKDIPSIIIDDEGDEFTPGGKKNKKSTKTGITHDKIINIIKSIKTCTFLSVTATPQANLLISTYDEISPDRLVLVRPGLGYTGGHAFFDTKDNSHIRIIGDRDDFVDSIPDSFKEALHFFIFSCCLKRSLGDLNPFSMLVHPSSFSIIQNTVATRIENFIETSISPAIINRNSIQYDDLIVEIKKSFNNYLVVNKKVTKSFEEIIENLSDVIQNIEVQRINYVNPCDELEENDALYKIKVGGNMLGRGLTIDRLIVSYIYRDSKIAQVDTMYQRCRWFGYKSNYFDVCRVYMTSELQEKFMAIVTNEDHMWNSMEAFLDSEINLKKFKRIFLLENEKLILTRRSVANTITLKILSSGNSADECISLTKEQKENNRNVYFMFCNKYEKYGKLVDFDTSEQHNQRHLLLYMSLSVFYQEFLSKIIFGFGSKFSTLKFKTLVEELRLNESTDEILIMLMRYGKGESRSPSNETMMNISRLFQGRNDGTNFSGDRYPIDINGKDYSKVQFFQIHMVDIYNKIPRIEDSIPLISFNNPLTPKTIKLVTGDNLYEE